MYIMIEDPETPGRLLYADLTFMTETTVDCTVSIIGVDVKDVVVEDDLARAIAGELRNVEINDMDVLQGILWEYYRILHIRPELMQAVQEIRGMELMTTAPTGRGGRMTPDTPKNVYSI